MAAKLRGEIKPGRASLIGGIAVETGMFALLVALARDLGAAGTGSIVAGLAVAAAIAGWNPDRRPADAY